MLVALRAFRAISIKKGLRYVHTLPNGFFVGMKTIPDRTSVHT